MTHTCRYTPIWLLVTSPAWADGFHRVVTHARCAQCGDEAYLAAWQSPRHLATRAGEQHPGRAQSRLREAGG